VLTAHLGLGSNLGDRLATLQAALDRLDDHDVRIDACSRVWATEPVGGPEGQPEFLNVVARVTWSGAPLDLLEVANAVEDEFGRVRNERWGPRTIDIDVLLIDGFASDDPRLTVPHPRMLERAFVMLPLLELDPDPLLPDGRRALQVTMTSGGARPFAPPLAVRDRPGARDARTR
jgi:2-amino-4-hydroxy-6-hydroxymethyldihydropteridine diphosphokinase